MLSNAFLITQKVLQQNNSAFTLCVTESVAMFMISEGGFFIL